MAQNRAGLQRLTLPNLSEYTRLTWSPDGQQIAISNDLRTEKIYIIDTETGSSRKLLSL
jgi:hypothetical protein